MTPPQSRRLVINTPSGPAWVDLDLASGPATPPATGAGTAQLMLVIGHGAGGSVDAPDLLAVRRHCLAAGISVARVTQPYRVAGKKAPPTAAALDAAWTAVVASLRRRKATSGLDVAFGGRSSGARVACRVAATGPGARPSAVVALAFPLHPPGRPDRSRLDELAGVAAPVLVVQGAQDPFGMPPQAPGRTVVVVQGDHSLKRSADEVGRQVAGFLTALPVPAPRVI